MRCDFDHPQTRPWDWKSGISGLGHNDQEGKEEGRQKETEGSKADTVTNKKGDKTRCPAARRTLLESIENP